MRRRTILPRPYISVNLTEQSFAQLKAMSGPEGRNALVRGLVLADLTEAHEQGSGLGDNRIVLYRKRAGNRMRNDPRVFVRLPQELRSLILARSDALGFTVSEYVAALLERHWQRTQHAKRAMTP